MLLDKNLFLAINILFILFFAYKGVFQKKYRWYLFSFIILLLFNVYFFYYNSERFDYFKLKNYNKSFAVNEVKCDITQLDSLEKEISKNLKLENNIRDFYKKLLKLSGNIKLHDSIQDNQHRRIFQIVILTSNLYGFGVKNAHFFAGNGICISNLSKGKNSYLSALKVAEYACCGDFCFITNEILTIAGYKTRYVITKQHIYLEVGVNNKWILLDPTYGIVYSENFLHKGNYQINLLPNFNLFNWHPNYRDKFYFTRNYMIEITLNNTLKKTLFKDHLSPSEFELIYF